MRHRERLDAIVIGAGHNGLVCATYLARAGLRTLVIERRAALGGAAGTSELLPGVRVPTLADTVGSLRPAVVRDLRLRDHGLRLVQPAARLFVPVTGGPPITLWGDVGDTVRDLERVSRPDARAYPRFDARVRTLSGFLRLLVGVVPPELGRPDLADALTGLRLGRAFRGLGARGGRELLRVAPMPVADWLGEWFTSDPLLGALALRGVRYTALPPRAAGTALTLLGGSVAITAGAAGEAVFAIGGPGALADALGSALRQAGGEVRNGVAVERIRVRSDRATGVVLAGGQEVEAPLVVSTLDPRRTLLELVPPELLGPALRRRARAYRLPATVAKVNLALADLPAFTGTTGPDDRRLRGRIALAGGLDGLERAFDAAKYGALPELPYVDATIPSLVDPSLVAPDNPRSVRHVLSAVVGRVPYEVGDGGWSVGGEALADRVLRVLETVAPGISDRVVARQVITPIDLERDYGLSGGHPLHGEPGLDQFFAWRPLLGHARYRMPLDGLYLAGSGAHPGGGVTGYPGSNAAREVLSDLKRGRRLP